MQMLRRYYKVLDNQPDFQCKNKVPTWIIARALLRGIIIGSISLFVAVSLNFLLTWFLTQNLPHAKTMAFAAWIVGHILLAPNF